VHGGEHQVAGQRRLHGDLRRLGVADLADHDLVRVVAQDGAQAAREGQALGLVDRDLQHVGSWYSTGSSMVMILSCPVLISESAAYSVVVLPLPVGPVTSSMP
jgi:hypothetical protein